MMKFMISKKKKRPMILAKTKKRKVGDKPHPPRKGRSRVWKEDGVELIPAFDDEEDIEETKGSVLFPSPKPKDKIFTSRWDEYVLDVVKRENFKKGHLYQLTILCDLYSEHDHLLQEIKKHGYFYEMVGKHGLQIRPRPEVSQLNKTRSEIRSYSKTLGLLLMKDKDLTPQGEEPEEWV